MAREWAVFVHFENICKDTSFKIKYILKAAAEGDLTIS